MTKKSPKTKLESGAEFPPAPRRWSFGLGDSLVIGASSLVISDVDRQLSIE